MEEKYKLKLQACFCVQEEVKSACFGTLALVKNEAKHTNVGATANGMEVVGGGGESSLDEIKMRTDIEYARHVVTQCISEVE
jgi:hypothetical protein